MTNIRTEINKESKIQKLLRIFAKVLFLIIVILTISILLLSVVTGQLIISTALFLLSAIECYLYLSNRIVRLIGIKDQVVIIQDGNKQIEIRKENILYLFKFVRFTFTHHYAFAIAVQNGRVFNIVRYIFFYDQPDDLLKLFKKMGINLKNIPT